MHNIFGPCNFIVLFWHHGGFNQRACFSKVLLREAALFAVNLVIEDLRVAMNHACVRLVTEASFCLHVQPHGQLQASVLG